MLSAAERTRLAGPIFNVKHEDFEAGAGLGGPRLGGPRQRGPRHGGGFFPEFDATTAWTPSHAPHGGRASYPGLKIYIPEWMATLYPGLRRKLSKQGYTWGHSGQYMHTDICDGTGGGVSGSQPSAVCRHR